MFNKIYSLFKRFQNRILFNQVSCNINNIIIGPDVDKRFTIKFAAKLVIGDGTAINGDCYINARV